MRRECSPPLIKHGFAIRDPVRNSNRTQVPAEIYLVGYAGAAMAAPTATQLPIM